MRQGQEVDNAKANKEDREVVHQEEQAPEPPGELAEVGPGQEEEHNKANKDDRVGTDDNDKNKEVEERASGEGAAVSHAGPPEARPTSGNDEDYAAERRQDLQEEVMYSR